MDLIVITDIFGSNLALSELVASFSGQYDTTTIIDPYGGENMRFDDEEAAYRAFQENCGQNKLSEKLETVISGMSSKADIVGFSVGGTCAWSISEKCKLKNIRNITCFYGSRIRERLSVSPQFPTTVIFPKYEKGFDIQPVIHSLKEKQNTEVVRTELLHGFMNKKSINFSEMGYQYFNKWLIEKSHSMA